jgi:hypothetical protein
VKITIALVAGPVEVFADFPPDEVWTTAYADRPKVDLDLDPSTTLGQAITSGLEALHYVRNGRIPFLPSSVAFRRPDDEKTGVGGTTYLLAVPTADGTAVWKSWVEVTLAELMASGDAGAVSGDPTQIYAVMVPPIGNGILPSWADLLQMLEVLRTTLGVFALPGAVAATVQLLRRWRSQAEVVTHALDAHAQSWGDRGVDPFSFDRWLDDKPWLPDELAALLGCSPSEAKAVLWAFGFGEAPSGLWRRELDEESTTLSRIKHDLIGTTSHHASEAELAIEFRRRLEHLITTGEASSRVDWDELAWMPRSLPGDSAHQARSRRSFAEMLRPSARARTSNEGVARSQAADTADTDTGASRGATAVRSNGKRDEPTATTPSRTRGSQAGAASHARCTVVGLTHGGVRIVRGAGARD